MSFTAMHWLSQDPKSLASHPTKCHVSQLTKAEKEMGWGHALIKQAARDWEVIVRYRLAELKTGGYFVCANFTHTVDARTNEDFYLGKSDIGTSMYDNFCKV